MRRWWCRRFGHKWSGQPALEHICSRDWCWRCWDEKWVHLTGPWEHTCGQYEAPESDDWCISDA